MNHHEYGESMLNCAVKFIKFKLFSSTTVRCHLLVSAKVLTRKDINRVN